MASKNTLEYVYNTLNDVIPGKIFYAIQVNDFAELPFIVYQEISKRSNQYADDKDLFKTITLQITLVTKNKNLELEKALEDKLDSNDIAYQMISEYYINEGALYRVYEIKMEEIKYEQ